MTLNPLTIYRKWRKKRQEHNDALLRLQSIQISTEIGGPRDICLKRAYTIYLFLKYGVRKDGISMNRIFSVEDPSDGYPEGPLSF